jgi:uncharacterized integral membrane protein (TIGR00697 family)
LNELLTNKSISIYVILTSLVICGLATSLVTAQKVIHLGIDFPFSNLVFSIFTYPLVDCICELWGKPAAQRTVWIALTSQLLIAVLIYLSIVIPPASFWTLQDTYQIILGSSAYVVLASLTAFGVSQLLDIFIYQRLKQLSRGKHLWLRSNLATYLGQIIDSLVFVSIVFHHSERVMHI